MKNRKRKTGFTLIEVMVALIVFMTAVMGLTVLYRTSAKGVRMGKQHTAAVNIGKYFMAQIQTEISNWYAGDGVNDPPFPASFPMLSQGYPPTGNWQYVGVDLGVTNFLVGEHLGHSKFTDGDVAPYRFCVNYQIVPMEENRTPGVFTDVKVWKVHVRVSWTKKGQFEDSAWQDCRGGEVDDRIANATTSDAADNAIELVGAATREPAV